MGENNWGVFLSPGFHNPGLRGLSLSVQLERHPLPLATIICTVKKTKQTNKNSVMQCHRLNKQTKTNK